MRVSKRGNYPRTLDPQTHSWRCTLNALAAIILNDDAKQSYIFFHIATIIVTAAKVFGQFGVDSSQKIRVSQRRYIWNMDWFCLFPRGSSAVRYSLVHRRWTAAVRRSNDWRWQGRTELRQATCFCFPGEASRKAGGGLFCRGQWPSFLSLTAIFDFLRRGLSRVLGRMFFRPLVRERSLLWHFRNMRPGYLHNSLACLRSNKGWGYFSAVHAKTSIAVIFLLLLLTPARAFSGELVGHNGAIGSLFRPLGGGNLQLPGKNDPIGELSEAGTPLIVATPASAVLDVFDRTVPTRRNDLTFLCNGMVRDILQEHQGSTFDRTVDLVTEATPTVACLYMGVMGRKVASPRSHVVAFSQAVPSVLHGRHAEALGSLFDEAGLPYRICSTAAEAREACLVKLVWSSALWLVCAETGCSVGEAHLTEPYAPLVSELWAVATATTSAGKSNGEVSETFRSVSKLLRAYSACLPGVVPSIQLARREIEHRNGWFLKKAAIIGEMEGTQPQANHIRLLQRHAPGLV